MAMETSRSSSFQAPLCCTFAASWGCLGLSREPRAGLGGVGRLPKTP